MRPTGYKELGFEDWWLVAIHPMLYADLISGIDLGQHILMDEQRRISTNYGVRQAREYIYFTDNEQVVHCFTQYFEITI